MRFYSIISVLILTTSIATAQVGGDRGYQVLNLSNNARSAALAGSTISLADGDISQFFQNPATLDSVGTKDLFFNINPYFAETIVFTGAYSFNVNKLGNIAVGLHYMDFGQFNRTDASGNDIGEFGAHDYVFTVGKAHKLGPVTLGVNTAILSRTGSYAGYGFAIPVNIVKKVFNDIVEHGEVQKAFIGADFIDIDSEMANQLEIEDLDGVIISNILKSGASEKANLEEGDVIRKVNELQIETKADLEELIANSYPGTELKLVVERNGKIILKSLVLTNREGTTSILKRNIYISERLEATFEGVSKVERDLLGIDNGVKVVDFKKTGFFASLSIPEGFIITQVNNKRIDDPEELANILENIRGRFDIIGINHRGRKVYYPFRR